MKPILKHTAALAALLTLSFSAAAHRVNLFAWSEGNAVQVESKFSDSTPVKGGKLTVTDTATGKVLASGKTSDTGTWRFTLPAATARKRASRSRSPRVKATPPPGK